MLLDCTVDVAGTRFNDGTGRPPGDPAAVILAGLTLIWGRPTSLDQPQPGTCTFSVADWTGTPDALDTLVIGAPVDVNAAGIDYGAPSAGTYTDPTITRLAPVSTSPGVTRAIQPDGAGLTLTAGAVPIRDGLRTYLRPDDPSSNPSAWLPIPRMRAGQTWQARVTGRAPAGTTCRLQVAPLATPGATPRESFALSGAPLVGAFDTTETFAPPSQFDGYWAALLLETMPAQRWTGATGTWAAQPHTWAAMTVTTVDRVDVLAPPPARTLDVRVFSGRLTDVQAAWDDTAGALVATVTAADFTADLANRRVAAAPWPKEAADQRIGRILTAAGGAAVATSIDPGLTWQVAPQDVDAQAPTALLKDVAVSVDAVMWAATSDPTGPYLRFENVSLRPSGMTLQLIGGLVYVVPGGTDDALILDACAVIRDPVTWRMDTGDVITRVGARWLEAGVGTDGKPTETDRTEWLVDTYAEPAFGVRSLTVDTQLTSQADALTVGARMAQRVFGPAWRIDGLTVDAAALADAAAGATSPAVILAELLDGTRRIGRLTQLSNLPSWAPGIYAPATDALVAYLEGGVYTYTGASWSLALVTSDARGQGPSLRWSDLTDNPWTWAQYAPAVTWRTLTGVQL